MSEPDLLRAFWALAGHASVVVSYNGRGFDVPFLVGRSLIHEVPVRVDLQGRPQPGETGPYHQSEAPPGPGPPTR